MSNDKMREALERLVYLADNTRIASYKDIFEAWAIAREALAAAPKPDQQEVPELTEAKIAEIALDGFMLSTAYGQGSNKAMPVSDLATLVKFARAVIAADRARRTP